MPRSLKLGLLTSISTAGVCSGLALFAASPALSKDCAGGLSDVLQDISSRGAIIATVNNRDAGGCEGNPFPGSKHLIIALEGSGQPSVNPKRASQAAQNILMSPQLNFSWAKKIMAACPDVAIVGFGMWQSGWQNMYYRFKDGQIRPKVCLAEMTKSSPWGVGWCD